MKLLTLVSMLAALTNVSAFAANSQPKPILSCGCSGDACGGLDVYNMGELKNSDSESKSYRVKFVVRGLGEGDESIITRYVGVVPDYVLAGILKGKSDAMPNSILALETDSSFRFGGMISDTKASLLVNGSDSLLIEPGSKAGTTSITQLLCEKK